MYRFVAVCHQRLAVNDYFGVERTEEAKESLGIADVVCVGKKAVGA